jgi:5S rRNA maturation endonuclease (ribonuclease M5)
MNPEERLEELTELIDELRMRNETAPILVEGDKDIRSLRALGIEGEILSINTGSSIFNFCEELSRKYSEVVILTDWDRKGGHLCRVLKEDLESNDVKYDDRIRARLAYLSRRDVKDVEGLAKLIENLRRKTTHHIKDA